MTGPNMVKKEEAYASVAPCWVLCSVFMS